tara:strand:- start:6567 stop:8630 length:2064 start_codon:yes stop_codon:yes gene_type:complete
MKLIITEKPSIARLFSQLLYKIEKESFENHDGYMASSNYYISWAYGHLVQAEEPATYGWDWNVPLDKFPLIPDKWQFKVPDDKSKQFNIIKKLTENSNIIINAADPGREGELIYRLIMMKSNALKKEQYRFWCTSTEFEDMAKEWKKLIPINKMDYLFHGALARLKADWLVGINASRGYQRMTSINNLSVGRVQTPTLALIVERDYMVENAKDKFYYVLTAQFNDFEFKYHSQDQFKFDTENELETTKKQLEGTIATLTTLDKSEKSKSTPLPHKLSSLQIAASNQFGISLDETMAAAQSLYEKQFTTYPRTSSQYLPTSMKTNAFQLAIQLCEDNMKSYIGENKSNSKVFDDEKLSDHYAIIPTRKKPSQQDLSDTEKKIYGIILSQFLASLSRPKKYNSFNAQVTNGKNTLSNIFNFVTDPGFTLFLNNNEHTEDNENSGTFPLQLNQRGLTTNAEIIRKKDKKPAYFTQATILKAMERADASIDDEELSKVLKETKGLGEEATKTEIIGTLFKRNFIEEKGKKLISTPLGRQLIKDVDPILKSPKLTAEWEQKIKDIEAAKIKGTDFIEELNEYLQQLSKTFTKDLSTNYQEFQTANSDKQTSCPVCGKKMFLGKKAASCSDKEHCNTPIFRNQRGKKLSDKQLIKLAQGKKIAVKGLISKTGSKYNGYLHFDKSQKKTIVTLE